MDVGEQVDGRLRAEVRADGDGRARVVLRGDVDGDADAALAQAYADVATAGADDVTLDFGATDYINSTGIALIVRFLADARRDRRSVSAAGLSAHYRELFRITRLSDYLRIEEEPA